MECFAECPFKHLAMYGLALSERLRAGLQRMDRGTLYHQVLARVMSRVAASGGRLGQTDRDALAEWIKQAVADYLAELQAAPHLAEPRSQYLLQRCEGDVLAVVLSCRDMAGRGNLRVISAEQAFGIGQEDAWPAWALGGPQGPHLELRGRIDRVDVTDGQPCRVVVIDYKTRRGTRQALRFGEFLLGCELQLPAYLAAACEHLRAEPGGAFYLPIIPQYQQASRASEQAEPPYLLRGIYSESAVEALDGELRPGQTSPVIKAAVKKDGQLDRRRSADALTREQMHEVLEIAGRTLLRLTERMLAGHIAPTPVERTNMLACDWCDYRSVCRFDPHHHPPRRVGNLTASQAIQLLREERDDRGLDA
jgi:ATP-dependent helicase/nuclease subunit B